MSRYMQVNRSPKPNADLAISSGSGSGSGSGGGNAQNASSNAILDQRFVKEVKSTIPKQRQDVLSWYGWGYKNTGFFVRDGIIHFKGPKYPLDGCALPALTEYVYDRLRIRPSNPVKTPELPKSYPPPTVNAHFMRELSATGIALSQEGIDRFIRCHGQTLHDIYYLWRNEHARIPDLVVWPRSHADVEQLVALAEKHNVVIIPYGGGTSVSGSISCPQKEQRTICILDTTQMNRMLWLDKENLTACFEAGIVGQDLERELQNEGLTVGHEPDSIEFSTLGGWVATRASGMKKNTYGNIEDLVVRVRMVTTRGVLERECSAPRVSCGPDFNHIVLGSEGTLGVVTEVVLKIRPLPSVKHYGSLIFPDFEYGVEFMREVARRRCQPSSVRLMDHEQFVLGQSMQQAKNWRGNMMDQFKKWYVSGVKGINLERICAVTLLFEGESADVARQEAIINEIARRHRGFPAGGHNGERGYIFTFVIAYIRDFAFHQDIIGESFETSVPWDRCSSLCRNVKRRIELECHSWGIYNFVSCCRVTQTYDAGACVYFYLCFSIANVPNPVQTYEAIETKARDEILASGGSLSHHHGVGKLRSQWYRQTVSPMGTELYKATKRQLDPKNIFAAGNLLTADEWKSEAERTQKDQEQKEQSEISPMAKSKL